MKGLGKYIQILYLIKLPCIIFMGTNAFENSIFEQCLFIIHPVHLPHTLYHNLETIPYFILFQNIYTFPMLTSIISMLLPSQAPNHHFQLFFHVLPKGVPTHGT